MKKIQSILVPAALLLTSSIANAAVVGPVTVLEQTNAGGLPVLCTSGLNNNAGGIIEMALDLDQDGTLDMCLGSNATDCNANFNFDASSHNTTLISTETNTEFMGGTGGLGLTLTALDGVPVGPNFQAASGSIQSENFGQTDVPLLFGFSGGSNSVATDVGFFSITVNSADCSISFGSVDIEPGANTYTSSAIAGPTSAENIPTLSIWGLLMLTTLIGLFGANIKRKGV